MVFDEYYIGRTPAERLDTDRTGSGEYIDETRAHYAGTQHIEQRFP